MIKIFPAETSLGSCNPGTELAPAALLKSGLRQALEYNQLEFEVLPAIRDKAMPGSKDDPKARNLDTLVDFNKRLYREIADTARPDDVVLALGGDHSTSIGSLYATKLRYDDAAIVYIDAHPDCASPDDSLSGNIHGMGLSTVLGDSLHRHFEYPKYEYTEAYLIGIKDVDPAEREYLHSNHILHVHMDEIIRAGIAEGLNKILAHLGERPLHVSLDIDSIDVSEAPGTGIINKGGLSYREVSYLCRHLAEQKIVAIDVVEVNPSRDMEDKTLALATELSLNLLGGEWSPYTQYMQNKH